MDILLEDVGYFAFQATFKIFFYTSALELVSPFML